MINDFRKSLSKKIIRGYKLNEDVNVYLFNYGIGVFSIRDENFIVNKERFAKDYCYDRREKHKNLCEFTHDYSDIMKKCINITRELYRKVFGKFRISANEEWQSKGISYVMTASFLEKQNFKIDENSRDDLKTLKILLEPSLAGEEDSLVSPFEKDKDNPYKEDLVHIEIPCNFDNKRVKGLYISWAALIVINDKITDEYINFIDSLEVDLQSLWMYIYCEYEDIRNRVENVKLKILPSELRKIKNRVLKLYNEFKHLDDTSMSDYVQKIRNELIRTSGLEEEKNKFLEYIDCCIEDAESLKIEVSKKYSWLSEILLFIIAYIDIVATIYTNFLKTESESVNSIMGIMAFVAFVLGIVLIIKKG